MANSNNMYGANLKEYALEVLRNKQVARSTMINWTGVIKNLPLENYQYPPNPTEIYNMVSDKYSNPRTKRAVLQTLNCLLGIKMKTGKASFPIHDLPDFEEVSSIIQKPKNKYQARCRMYANLFKWLSIRVITQVDRLLGKWDLKLCMRPQGLRDKEARVVALILLIYI